jgi:hypothetical protein
MRLHPRQQFPGAEGLDQIIVGAMFHSFHARFLARPRGKQNDRDGLRFWIRAQFVQQTKAVEIRHHYVGQN